MINFQFEIFINSLSEWEKHHIFVLYSGRSMCIRIFNLVHVLPETVTDDKTCPWWSFKFAETDEMKIIAGLKTKNIQDMLFLDT